MSTNFFAVHCPHPRPETGCNTRHMVAVYVLGRWSYFSAVVDDFGSLVIVGGPL